MLEPQDVHRAVTAEITALLAEDGKAVTALGEQDSLVGRGIDSLGFAVLITRLEDRLGYDPFDVIERGEFPRTVGELVAAYVETRPAGA